MSSRLDLLKSNSKPQVNSQAPKKSNSRADFLKTNGSSSPESVKKTNLLEEVSTLASPTNESSNNISDNINTDITLGVSTLNTDENEETNTISLDISDSIELENLEEKDLEKKPKKKEKKPKKITTQNKPEDSSLKVFDYSQNDIKTEVEVKFLEKKELFDAHLSFIHNTGIEISSLIKLELYDFIKVSVQIPDMQDETTCDARVISVLPKLKSIKGEGSKYYIQFVGENTTTMKSMLSKYLIGYKTNSEDEPKK